MRSKKSFKMKDLKGGMKVLCELLGATSALRAVPL
jgi:hypothetical protein